MAKRRIWLLTDKTRRWLDEELMRTGLCDMADLNAEQIDRLMEMFNRCDGDVRQAVALWRNESDGGYS